LFIGIIDGVATNLSFLAKENGTCEATSSWTDGFDGGPVDDCRWTVDVLRVHDQICCPCSWQTRRPWSAPTAGRATT
jgi:hypothetical protein